MKKLILLVVVGLFTLVLNQSCNDDDVYMDEQIEVSNDLQKDGGADIVPFGDETSGGSYYCSGVHNGKTHSVREFKTSSPRYKCYRTGEITPHWSSSYSSSANYHCKTGF